MVGLERYVVFNVRISLYYSFQIRSIFHPVVYCQSSTAIAIRFGVNMLSDRSFMWLLDVAKVPSCLSHSCCCTAFAIWSKPTPTAKPAMLVKVMMMTQPTMYSRKTYPSFPYAVPGPTLSVSGAVRCRTMMTTSPQSRWISKCSCPVSESGSQPVPRANPASHAKIRDRSIPSLGNVTINVDVS